MDMALVCQGRIVNSGVGNITSSTISDVGNDNSRRLYRESCYDFYVYKKSLT